MPVPNHYEKEENKKKINNHFVNSKHDKSMQSILLICIGLLLASCGGEKQPKSTVAAIESGEKTRMEWQKARKPVEIRIEGTEGTAPAWPRLGVYMDIHSSSPEEREAFAGAEFMWKGGVYVSPDRNAVTSDTTAAIYVCHPFRKGLGVDGAIQVSAPFDENLYGVETARNVGDAIQPVFRLQSAMSLLRIVCESDDLRDRLDGIEIMGEHIYTEGCFQPYTGRWLDKKAIGGIRAGSADCLLNNGRKHDVYLIPTETACSVTITIRVNGKLHALRTMFQPLTAGIVARLSIRKNKEGIAINGSWVETERDLAYVRQMMSVDSVQVGHYLQRDGSIQAERDTLSIAVVMETDGKHGKAVALSDSDGLFVFAERNVTSGKRFPTIDGKSKEGILNPATNIGKDDKIIYKPGMPYPADCALGYADGASLTQALMETHATEPQPSSLGRSTMLHEAARHPGGYVPSLCELAQLYYLLECDKSSPIKGRIEDMSGEYLTSTESGADTFYLMDFTHGIVTGGLSKRYARAKLRLFYLF